MDIVKVFGTNLKKYRTAMGLSQEDFADKCGMHRTYISAIECYRLVYRLKIFKELRMHLKLKHISYFWRNKHGTKENI